MSLEDRDYYGKKYWELIEENHKPPPPSKRIEKINRPDFQREKRIVLTLNKIWKASQFISFLIFVILVMVFVMNHFRTLRSVEKSSEPSTKIETSKVCTCSEWIRKGCGEGGCPRDRMWQVRNCDPSGCQEESQCVTDKDCAIPIYSIGEEIKAGDLKWKILRVRNRGSILKGSESIYYSWNEDRITEGKFIEVEIMVENIGKEPYYFSVPVVYDDQGRKFTHANGVYNWIPETKNCDFMIEIKPGFSPKECIEIYEVAKDSRQLFLYIESTNWKEKGSLVFLGEF